MLSAAEAETDPLKPAAEKQQATGAALDSHLRKSASSSPLASVKEWAEMIKIEHTVFALPFALSGMLLASDRIPDIKVWFWTILAFAGARSAAMTLNRLIDSSIDALNPRTSSRAIAAGRISKTQALLFTVAAFCLMLFAASNLPPLCLMLSPIAVFWLSFYSFTKRFTYLCHFVLGIALGGAALGGWIAAGGSLNQPAPFLLALAVSCWVAGFDLFYALQDIAFDREQRLHSVPAFFGIEKTLTISAFLHTVTVAALIILGVISNLGACYFVGVAIVALMLKYEHSLLRPDDLSKIDAAFFNVNGMISIAMFVCILCERLLS